MAEGREQAREFRRKYIFFKMSASQRRNGSAKWACSIQSGTQRPTDTYLERRVIKTIVVEGAGCVLW